jgi:4-amino-4-deoxy-L-arabinose transferase-like glycosyltransferase
MRFDLDHDWQGNMSTPRTKLGERAKTHLLLILCALWLCMGLVGHSPWKPFESNTVSIIKSLDESLYLAPIAASHGQIENPPLYYISAAASAKLLSPILPMHDGARVATGLWMMITLLMLGMTGRELWGAGVGRQTALVFIGLIGLVVNAHTLTPMVSSLTGIATAFYALCLAKRRPYRASILLGLGMGVAFLSTGLLPLLIILISTLLLPVLFSAWRSKSFAQMVLMALLVASPFLLIWPILCQHFYPILFNDWWQHSLEAFQNSNHGYFLETLIWYAWPALPLAIWGFWRHRTQIFGKPRFQLILTFFLVALALIGFGSDNKEIFALPLLVPLTAMAGGSVESLKRGTAGALNWFGLILFGLISGAIWLGWVAMLTGNPAKLKERLTFLSGLGQLNLNYIAVIFALFASLIWLFSILRSQHSNRSSATNWAIGMTTVWTLLMTLWLPLIDSSRSYQGVFTSLKVALPAKYACATGNNIGDSQKDLLHYFAGLKTQNLEFGSLRDCDLYVVQDEKGRERAEPGADWKLIWSGKRASERRESFRLFQRVSH